MNLSKASLVGLALMYLLSGCKQMPEQVSAEIRPTSAYLTSYYDTIPVTTTVVMYNRVVANEFNTLLVGSYQDPVFGEVKADAFGQFVLPSDINTLGPNTKFNALRLKISFGATRSDVFSQRFFSQYFYGDATKPQRVHIYRLQENINPSKLYYTTDSIMYSGYLGSFEVVSGNSIDIPLSSVLGQEFIQNVFSFTPSSNFYNQFKGLAFIAENNHAAVWRMTNVRMVLYYHNFFGLNNIRVDDSLTIFLDRNVRTKFSRIHRDYSSSTVLNSFQNAADYDSISATDTGNKMYIQAMTGVHTRISWVGLEDLVRRHKGKILVNRAELVILPDTTEATQFPLPRTLYAYELDADRKILNGNQFIQRDESDIFGFTNPQFSLLVDNNKYVFLITTYIQALIDGRKPNYGLMVGATADLSQSGVSMTEISRFRLFNSHTGKRSIQLRIFYTVYN